MAPPPITLWERQSITNSIGDFKNTVSSWDNCMNQPYCKWPVIIAIILASCILLSLLTCLLRCLCCGAECCCACLSCCNACCPSPSRNRRNPHTDPKYGAPPPNPYASPYHPAYNASPAPTPYTGYMPAPAPTYAPSPQPHVATFDATPGTHRGTGNAPANEDALPPMPSWDTAPKRKVPEEGAAEELEMGHLSPRDEKAPMLANQAPTPIGGAVAYHSQSPAPYGGAAAPHSPSPYGGGAAGYAPGGMGAAGAYGGRSPYARPPQQGYAPYAASHVSAATSTRYEPSSVYAGQESGTVFHSSPPAQGAGAPIGRKPLVDSWREV